MALGEINKDAISFKRLNGKAHTQSGFTVSNESITSNVQIALTTVFGETPNPLPASVAGLTNLGDTDGIVQKVRFEIDIIPDTQVAPGESQGYQLKLPSGYDGLAYAGGVDFPPGTYLWEALGKLQIVPALYGTATQGTTEYDPVLYQTDGITEIPKFDAIDWLLDSYSGVLFVQDPANNFDTSPARPGFIDAYLYVGEYLDTVITGASATILSAGRGISSTDFSNNTVSVDLQDYTAPDDIRISITGDGNTFIMRDVTNNRRGIQYAANYAPTFVNRSLVDKQYVDSIASGLSIRESVNVASTSNVNIGASATTVIDGITLVDGFRVLLKDQTDARQNGIYRYVSASTGLVRSSDFDSSSEIVSGAFTAVLTGVTNAGFLYAVSSPDPLTLNASEIQWTRLALPLVYFGGVGIDINGQNIDIDGVGLAGVGLTFNGSFFNVAISGTNLGQGEEVFKEITTEGESETYNFRRLTGSGGTTVITSGDTIVISSSGGTGSEFIGVPDDNTYTDGLFSSWTADTKISNAFDDVNEFLLNLAPPFAPVLDEINSENTFVLGNLSFGTSNNDIAYTVVTGIGGSSAVDINGLYTSNLDRKGIINGDVGGILNSDVDDDNADNGIPYEDGAFKYGNQGFLVLEVNGSILEVLNLSTGSTGIITTNLGVSALKYSKFSTGSEFTQSPYRTGTYDVTTSDMVNGWNYARVIHSGTTEGDIETNYQEWVYDPNANNISGSTATLSPVTLTGTKNISGIEYNTGGEAVYNVTISNAYRNVYSDSNNAIAFPNRDNLSVSPGDGFEMDISGSGINNAVNQTTFTLPTLDQAVGNPAATNITFAATMPINTNRVLGSINVLGRLRSQISIDHPFSAKELTNASQATENGFLVYNINDSSTNTNENFTGENFRLQDQDYTGSNYATVSSGFAYDGSVSLLGTSGMLVFDGSLYYPSSNLLSTEYGITNGDFSDLNNAPVNPNYDTASGVRNYFRRFTANTTLSLDALEITINHGVGTTFSTSGSLNTPSPSGDQVVFELIVYRPSTANPPIDSSGYFNPFASLDNPLVIENTGINVGGTTTTLSCSLKSLKVGNGDVIILRMRFADGYSSKITNVDITNI